VLFTRTTDLMVEAIVVKTLDEKPTQAIRNRFARRPHWRQHFTPTSLSWLNRVERFSALLADQQIERGAHTSVEDLIKSIEAFVDRHNADPKPLRWTKSADDILV
jgi:hypothetical protein